MDAALEFLRQLISVIASLAGESVATALDDAEVTVRRDALALTVQSVVAAVAVVAALAALLGLYYTQHQLRLEEEGRRASYKPRPIVTGRVEVEPDAIYLTVKNIGTGLADELEGQAWLALDMPSRREGHEDEWDRVARELERTPPHLLGSVGALGAGDQFRQPWIRQSAYPGDPKPNASFLLVFRFRGTDIADQHFETKPDTLSILST